MAELGIAGDTNLLWGERSGQSARLIVRATMGILCIRLNNAARSVDVVKLNQVLLFGTIGSPTMPTLQVWMHPFCLKGPISFIGSFPKGHRWRRSNQLCKHFIWKCLGQTVAALQANPVIHAKSKEGSGRRWSVHLSTVWFTVFGVKQEVSDKSATFSNEPIWHFFIHHSPLPFPHQSRWVLLSPW